MFHLPFSSSNINWISAFLCIFLRSEEKVKDIVTDSVLDWSLRSGLCVDNGRRPSAYETLSYAPDLLFYIKVFQFLSILYFFPRHFTRGLEHLITSLSLVSSVLLSCKMTKPLYHFRPQSPSSTSFHQIFPNVFLIFLFLLPPFGSFLSLSLPFILTLFPCLLQYRPFHFSFF